MRLVARTLLEPEKLAKLPFADKLAEADFHASSSPSTDHDGVRAVRLPLVRSGHHNVLVPRDAGALLARDNDDDPSSRDDVAPVRGDIRDGAARNDAHSGAPHDEAHNGAPAPSHGAAPHDAFRCAARAGAWPSDPQRRLGEP